MVVKIEIHKHLLSDQEMERYKGKIGEYIRNNITQDDACKFIENCIEQENPKIAECSKRVQLLHSILDGLREITPNDNIFKTNID